MRTTTQCENACLKENYCRICQYPFTPHMTKPASKHLSNCKRRKLRPKMKCSEGVRCISTLESHFRLYSHDALAQHRKESSGASMTSCGENASTASFNTTSGQGDVKSEPMTFGCSSGLREAFVDLTDSQASSEEFKNTQSSRTHSCSVLQNSVRRATSTPPLCQISFERTHAKRKQNMSTHSVVCNSKRAKFGQKNYRASPSQTAMKATKSEGTRKVVKKIKVCVNETPMSANPWSIAANQKRCRTPLKKAQRNDCDVIDLTKDSDETSQSSSVDTIISISPRKSPRKVLPFVTPQKSRAGNPDALGEVQKSSSESKAGNLQAPVRDCFNASKPNSSKKFPVIKIHGMPSKMKLSQCKESSPRSSLKPRKLNLFSETIRSRQDDILSNTQLHSTQAAKENTSSKLLSTMKTEDSEEWSVPLPRGPGFIPISPIAGDVKSIVSDSDGDDIFADILGKNKTKNTGSQHLEDESGNSPKIISKLAKNLEQNGEDHSAIDSPAKHAKEALSEAQNGENVTKDSAEPLSCASPDVVGLENDDSEDMFTNSLDYSLLSGLTKKQTLPFVNNMSPSFVSKRPSSKIPDVTPVKVTDAETPPSKKKVEPRGQKSDRISSGNLPKTTPNPVNGKSGNFCNNLLNTQKILPGILKPGFSTGRNQVETSKRQSDIGTILFGMKPKVKQDSVETEEGDIDRKNSGGGRRSSHFSRKKAFKRRCPFYKKVSGTDIAVDAFSYGMIEGIRYFFLSHFHADHYMGLNKKTWKQKIYCARVTGNLVVGKLGISENLIVRLPMWVETSVGDAAVTLLEANHCPGAVLYLFKLHSNRVILHTGDFRAQNEMEKYSALQGLKIETLYLDTTYLNPRYRFPLQCDAIKAIVSLATKEMRESPSTLFVVGTYLIGKERVFAAVAKAIGSLVYVTPDKFRTIKCLEDERLNELITMEPGSARLHVVAMRDLNLANLKSRLSEYPKYERIVAIKPTGWTHGQSKPVISGSVSIHGLPYSEHSSFDDLRQFVKFLRPSRIVPTVNVGSKEVRDAMSSYLDKWKLGLDP